MTVNTVEGELTSLRPLSADVIEVGIRTAATLPHHAGQYAQVTFAGYPGRPFSITHPLRSNPDGRALYFHIRRMENGRLTPHLGHRIRIGHKVSLAGPFGSAYFRPDGSGRLILVATNTGFAPIWSIAVAALRENPARRMMIIAGGRKIEALYMATALSQLVQFPNVLVVPVCSSQKTVNHPVMPGRPTDYMPYLLPTDSVYACGAPAMVDAIKAVSAHFGATCFADPFMPAAQESREEARVDADAALGRLLLQRTLELVVVVAEYRGAGHQAGGQNSRSGARCDDVLPGGAGRGRSDRGRGGPHGPGDRRRASLALQRVDPGGGPSARRCPVGRWSGIGRWSPWRSDAHDAGRHVPGLGHSWRLAEL